MAASAPILIVEDNVINMRLFSDLLVALGYTVYKAGDAEKALELLKEIRPGAIIMDIQLPGMSGVDCTKVIRADPDLADIPIIAVTAFAMAGDEARFLKAGCDDCPVLSLACHACTSFLRAESSQAIRRSACSMSNASQSAMGCSPNSLTSSAARARSVRTISLNRSNWSSCASVGR